mgnify:CR=1 FL=1
MQTICRAGCPHPAAEKPYHLQQTLQITCRGRCSPSSRPPGPAISPTAKTRKSLFPLIHTPYCKPQPVISVDISFFPAVYYTSVAQTFWGKAVTACQSKHRSSARWTQRAGRYISGQELADQLGVSRAAIWKAVTALRADGTPIEAITNRGYALPHGADLLNADASQRC